MQLYLEIKENKITVQCQIMVSSDSFSFALGATLEVFHFKNNQTEVFPVVEPYEFQFRPPMKKYTLSKLEKGILSFEYYGILEGNLLFMQEEIYHFSLYNGWYPIGFDVMEEYELTVKCEEAYKLINGCFDSDARCWHYTTQNQSLVDCNIMLINKAKAHCLENDGISLYYFNDEYKKILQLFFEEYTSIYQFYLSLYQNNKLNFNTIVFLPKKFQLGAYKRDNLIVFSEVSKDLKKEIHKLAHEMAHAYAVGADMHSWEDWLNETHAEWSALLYEEEYHPAYFEHLIQIKKENYQGDWRLNPKDGHRPNDVHETGTLLYYKIYQKYGSEAIRTLLRAFDRSEEKQTTAFLNMLMEEEPKLAKEIDSLI
ncbi:hypothetical protein [Beduini sp.]|uniref:hypothetical protein n=1 Tax=Beduini sp. TaxID=1922300 RepID=UPI0039A2E8D2